MTIRENISLRPFTSFGIEAQARYFATFGSTEELRELLSRKTANTLPQTLILGGGSNLLFTCDFDGLVLKNEIKGISELHEDNEYVYVKAGAGENWHQFVLYCIERNWSGLENLSLIPGNVGASPMQNIGAYGVEVEDLFWDLEAWHIPDKKLVTFTRSDCGFGYRESVFKRKYRDQFVILNVTYRLRKKPRFNTSYGAIEQELERMGVKELSAKAISDAVIRIRRSKLPDPKDAGNAGSFFKNPSVTSQTFEELKTRFPDIVGYPNADGSVKLAAGWLIEQCGPKPGTSWKGFRRGDAGCHAKQALVLVNYGNATGKEIFDLSEDILQTVKLRFGVELEREVNVVGSL
ncbi:MAG: UDP-N-acetylmuramate dehydrogenase [Sphingobacteriales bacterium]|nr:UDP-N-acetylmuramate dehydrogenase [Sphingobacteriales bacterium]